MNDITKTGNGTLAEVPKLSPELSRILAKRRLVTGYGGDEGMNPAGADFRDGAWEAPEWVDIRERDEARAALPVFEALKRPISHDRIRDFLLMLWNVTRHSNDMDWSAIAAVYPMMLDGHPGWCFRPERLKLASHAFAWFPSVQELVAFMEPDRQAINDRVESLRKVSETTTSPPKSHRPGLRPWAEGGAEDHAKYLRDKADRERRELVEIMRKRDEEAGRKPADVDIPERAPGEDGKAYVERLVAHTRDQISLGAAARRADEARYRRAKGIEAEERVMQTRRPSPPPTPDAMRSAYAATGIKPQDLREAQTASETAQNTMSFRPSEARSEGVAE